MQLSSCSFQSAQLDYIRGILDERSNSSEKFPSKNWVALWVNKSIDLYAVNLNDQVIFADSNINIFFKKNHIYKVTGLLPNNEVISIDFFGQYKDYKLNGNQISFDKCEDFQSRIDDQNVTRSTQICYDSSMDNYYKNEITLNSEMQLIKIKIVIHPSYPPIELSIK